VFLALAARCDGAVSCSATAEEIGRASGISARHVKRILVELEAAGRLQIERRTGRGNGHNYLPIADHTNVKRVTCMHTNNLENANEISERVTSVSYSTVVDEGDVILSEEIAHRRDRDKRAIVVARRQRVRDGFLSFIAMLDAGQYVTVPALAHELGMSPNIVRTDLQAVFRSLDISIPDQMRLKKSQRKPWHYGKISRKPVHNLGERG
jgi:hypothetical protein